MDAWSFLNVMKHYQPLWGIINICLAIITFLSTISHYSHIVTLNIFEPHFTLLLTVLKCLTWWIHSLSRHGTLAAIVLVALVGALVWHKGAPQEIAHEWALIPWMTPDTNNHSGKWSLGKNQPREWRTIIGWSSFDTTLGPKVEWIRCLLLEHKSYTDQLGTNESQCTSSADLHQMWYPWCLCWQVGFRRSLPGELQLRSRSVRATGLLHCFL